jgi:twinkle protein
LTVSDVRDVLNDAGIRLRTYAPGQYKTTCPLCSAGRKHRTDPCLSVTVKSADDAVWHCHNCGDDGGSPRDRVQPLRERKVYRRPERAPNPERPDKMVAWFEGRGIGKATIEAAGIFRTKHWFPQLEGETDCIAFPYEWRGELRNVKYRDASKNFVQEKNPEPVLYGANSIVAGEDLIFVEGEIDVLSMREAGFPSVVSLPNGAPAKPETSDRRYEPLETHAFELEQAGRILIATDMDGPGKNLADELARRLGKDRCWRVQFPNANDIQLKDANEVLVQEGAEVLRECVASAEPWPVDGLFQADVFADDVVRMFRGQGPKPLSTGFDELDKAFRVLPGQFVVVSGIPNHGKSRFLDQVAVQISRKHGWKWLVYSPETGNENHVADLCEIVARQPFHPGPTPRMSESEMREAMAVVRESFLFLDTKEHTPSIDWLLERAKSAVLRYGIRGLILDPYNEIEAGRPAGMTETEFVSQLISKCKRFAKAHDVTVFIVHPTKINSQGLSKEAMPGLYDLAGSAHWRNKADAGLIVYRDFEERITIVASKKIRRQPICGTPGMVKFVFLASERIFEAIPGSFSQAGGEHKAGVTKAKAPRKQVNGARYDLDLAETVAARLRQSEFKPTRLPFAVDALDEFARAGRDLLLRGATGASKPSPAISRHPS